MDEPDSESDGGEEWTDEDFDDDDADEDDDD
jgi:hypothetical protein